MTTFSVLYALMAAARLLGLLFEADGFISGKMPGAVES